MALNRRSFLKGMVLSGIATAGILGKASSVSALVGSSTEYATLINVDKCDACALYDTPQCVLACRNKNKVNFPEPEQPMADYWPQKKHEDWSDKKNLVDRLTPYNWTYVQHVEVEFKGKKVKVNVPRRCMHCDNPPCSALCPFGVNNKMPEGPVVIDGDGCFGGAKCRDVCPWQIPQRQAGVGIYKEIAPDYVGGGVMYKCDMCHDLIVQGQEPACVSACPSQAIAFGEKQSLKSEAGKWARDNNGYIYGDLQNGGTSTFYISSVPFELINEAIENQDLDGKPGKIHMKTEIENTMNEPTGMVKGMLIAPLAGLMASGLTAYKIMKGADDDENTPA